MQVQQRDNEIALLINMLKGRTGTAPGSHKPSDSTISSSSHVSKGSPAGGEAADTAAASDAGTRRGDSGSAGGGGGEAPVLSALLDASLLSDRHKAFEVFRHSYRQGQVQPTCMQAAIMALVQLDAWAAGLLTYSGSLLRQRTKSHSSHRLKATSATGSMTSDRPRSSALEYSAASCCMMIRMCVPRAAAKCMCMGLKLEGHLFAAAAAAAVFR
jgi:hypothetical protein